MAREADDRLILYGRHPVLEALRGGARRVDELLIEGESARGADLVALARQAGVRLARVPRSTLTALAGTPHHQGVVARVAARPYADLEELLAVPRAKGKASLFVLLDQVQDPGNLGNLLRTAEALGVHGVVVLRHQGVGLTGHAVKAAAGAVEYLPVARVGNLVHAIEILQSEGCWVVGASATPGELPPPWRIDLRGPVALVLGSEGRGLRPLVARRCDALTRIPLVGRVASLNVAAAGAALLYEVVRQRAESATRSAGAGGPRPPGEGLAEKAVDSRGLGT